MKYTQKKTIARNGFGEIALAECHISESPFPVIMKFVIPALTKSISGKFVISKMFDHPCVQKVIDFGSDSSLSTSAIYYTCKHINGITLTQLLNRISLQNIDLPLFFAHHIMIGICSGLSYVHDFFGTDQKDFLPHGNIHPDNIIISFNGDIYLTDSGFGDIVKYRYDGEVLKRNERSIFTHPDIIKNTTHLKKSHELYSVGVLFYYLISGFKSKQIPMQIPQNKIISGHLQQLPNPIKKIISNLIFHKSGTKYESLSEVLNDLQNFYPNGIQYQKENTAFLLYILFRKEYQIPTTIQSFFCQYANYYLNSIEDESVKIFLLELSKQLPFISNEKLKADVVDEHSDSIVDPHKDFMNETQSIVIPKEIVDFYNLSNHSVEAEKINKITFSNITDHNLQKSRDNSESDISESLSSEKSPLIYAFSRIIKDSDTPKKIDSSKGKLQSCSNPVKIKNDSFLTFSKSLKDNNTLDKTFLNLIRRRSQYYE
jgi:hypothetical protein